MEEYDDLEMKLTSRNYIGVTEIVKDKKVAIAGLGGLGSNIAIMLARIGIGHLLLIDYDIVDETNLNRQHYNINHIGIPKSEALSRQIDDINPYLDINVKNVRITKENVKDIFSGYPIVCEALDTPADKAMLVNALLEDGDKKVIAASGMAGCGSANLIKTVKRFENLYISGDTISEAEDSLGLMAPRVMICAAHQANMVLRLLLGIQVV